MLTFGKVFMIDKRTETYEKTLEREALMVEERFKNSFRKIKHCGLVIFLKSAFLYGLILGMFVTLYENRGIRIPIVSMIGTVFIVTILTTYLAMRNKSIELLKEDRSDFDRFVFKKMIFTNIRVIKNGMSNRSVKILGYDVNKKDTILISINDGKGWMEKELFCKFLIKESDDNILEFYDDHIEAFISRDMINTLITKEGRKK